MTGLIADSWGVGGYNGADFTVTAGTYDIWLNDITGDYILIPVATPAPTPDNLYLVGDATEAGWSPTNNNTPLFKDPNEEGVFTFTGYFIGGGEGFKLLEIGDWTPQWGKGANDGELAGKPVTQDGDPSAIPVPESGYYSLRVDFNTLSYTFEPYDASGATEYATIGVIGDATPTGWASDTDMTQSTIDTHLWYIQGFTVVDGPMKFRADDDWADSWGVGGYNGADFTVTAGTYDIWLNDITGDYILINQ